MEETIQPHIIPAILENESISGHNKDLDKLLLNLSQFAERFKKFGLDPSLIGQAFRQVIAHSSLAYHRLLM